MCSWVLTWPDEGECELSVTSAAPRENVIASILLRGEKALSEYPAAALGLNDAAQLQSPALRHRCETLRLRWRFGKLSRTCLTEYIFRDDPDATILMTPDLWRVELESDGRTLVKYMLGGAERSHDDYSLSRTYRALSAAKFRFGLASLRPSSSQLENLLANIQECLQEDRIRILADILLVLLTDVKLSGDAVLTVNAARSDIEAICNFRGLDATWLIEALKVVTKHIPASLGLIAYLATLQPVPAALVHENRRLDLTGHSDKIAKALRDFRAWWASGEAALDQMIGASLVVMASSTRWYGDEGRKAFNERLETLRAGLSSAASRALIAGLTYGYYTEQTTAIASLRRAPPQAAGSPPDNFDTAVEGNLAKEQPNPKAWWAKHAAPPQLQGRVEVRENLQVLLFVVSIACGARPVKCCFIPTPAKGACLAGGELCFEHSAAVAPAPAAIADEQPLIEVVERLSVKARSLAHVSSRLSGSYLPGDWNVGAVSLQLASDLSVPGKAPQVAPIEHIAITTETVVEDLPQVFAAIAEVAASRCMLACFSRASRALCTRCARLVGAVNSVCVTGNAMLDNLLRVYADRRSAAIDPSFIITQISNYFVVLMATSSALNNTPVLKDAADAIRQLMHKACHDLVSGCSAYPSASRLALAEAMRRLCASSCEGRLPLPENRAGIASFVSTGVLRLKAAADIWPKQPADLTSSVCRLSLLQTLVTATCAFSNGLGEWLDISQALWILCRSLTWVVEQPDLTNQPAREVLQICAAALYKASCEKPTRVCLDLRSQLSCQKLLR